MNLFEYTAQYKNAMVELQDMDLPLEVIADTLEGLKGELTEKGKNVGAYIRNLEADAKAIKDAENAMSERRMAIGKRISWMKTYLLENMQAAEITEISCPHYVIKVKKNPPAVVVTDEILLPRKYMIETVTERVDKKSIAVDLKSGETVNGAYLEQKMRLDIK